MPERNRAKHPNETEPNTRTVDAIREIVYTVVNYERIADTRYYVDPSLAAAAMGAGPGDLMNDLKTFGFFFETLVVRDLRVYADALGGDVRHYRDKAGLECDAVVHLPNGAYGLVEVKTGGTRLIDQGAATLGALSGLIAKKGLRPATFRMVVTAVGEYAYCREEDGVLVCPIGCLKP